MMVDAKVRWIYNVYGSFGNEDESDEGDEEVMRNFYGNEDKSDEEFADVFPDETPEMPLVRD